MDIVDRDIVFNVDFKNTKYLSIHCLQIKQGSIGTLTNWSPDVTHIINDEWEQGMWGGLFCGYERFINATKYTK